MEQEGIFISYRRSDLPHAAGRLNDTLSREFGERRIFRDLDDIEAGVDFTLRLNEALASCKVMLVLMGNAWLNMAGAQGQGRRLDEPGDWVRQEIATALQRGVRVIPLLLEEAQMPAEADLPDDLKPLSRRQALSLSDARWHSDVDHLMRALHHVLAPDPGTVPVLATRMKQIGAEAGKWGRRLLMLGLGALALIVFLLLLLVRSCNSDTPEVAGLWYSDSGAPFEFVRADKSDHKDKRAYTVQAVQNDFSRLACDASPSFFGSLTMQCRVFKAGVVDDRWACTSLMVNEAPPAISGTCKWERDGRSTTLALRRAGK